MLASGGAQNFLGAKWVALTVRHTPTFWRKTVALRFLALSPHYFNTTDRESEADRIRKSRVQLTDDLLVPHLQSNMRVIDFGCGPGYCASAVSSKVEEVEAVDISAGVLACASVLNPAPNIHYLSVTESAGRTEPIDLVYSFAVVQHMSDEVLKRTLINLRRRLRTGGILLLHFASVEDGWRTEQEWRSDTTLLGRTKLRVGLNCFGRSREIMTDLLNAVGFNDVRIEDMTEYTNVEDDIATQHWVLAR
jgi:cyclopropane fatty-acyl-phospholipid synthase-like methyltransferase